MGDMHPRVLFLTPRHPFPPMRGDQRRTLHLLEGLAAHARVSLVTFGGGEELPFEGVRVRTVGRSATGTLAANATASPQLPLQVRLYLEARMRQAVGEEVERLRPDVAHVTLARLGPYMPADGVRHAHVDLIDCLSLNMATRARASRAPMRAVLAAEARLMRRYEGRLAARADSCSVVSERDRAAIPGGERVAVIPNGVDLAEFPFSDPADRPPVLLFFGNLGYSHNVAPARFVAMEVLPRVRRELPETRLRLVGARPTQAARRLAELDGVEVAADVPSIADELHGAAVATLPMFTGSGIKNKVLEAFCSGTPVVTNALGIDGVDGARGGEHHLEAEGADGIARCCLRLLRDGTERSTLAGRAHELVRHDYSWKRRVESLLELYEAGLRRSGRRLHG
jgi:glycosyltransferase involved in cell wall biosynthesis